MPPKNVAPLSSIIVYLGYIIVINSYLGNIKKNDIHVYIGKY